MWKFENNLFLGRLNNSQASSPFWIRVEYNEYGELVNDDGEHLDSMSEVTVTSKTEGDECFAMYYDANVDKFLIRSADCQER